MPTISMLWSMMVCEEKEKKKVERLKNQKTQLSCVPSVPGGFSG